MRFRTLTRPARMSLTTIWASLGGLYVAAHLLPLLLADLATWIDQ